MSLVLVLVSLISIHAAADPWGLVTAAGLESKSATGPEVDKIGQNDPIKPTNTEA